MKSLGKKFSKCQAYITSQIERAEREGERSDNRFPAITISRETGAGAVTLGENLAKYLNDRIDKKECEWTVFDKNLIQKVLEDHDLPARLERFMPEDIQDRVREIFGDMFGIHPPDWELLKLTNDTIYRLAKMGNCIIVGRGANIVTRNLPTVLHVRLIGSLSQRISRCMKYYGMSEKEARERINTQDRARRRYVLAHFDHEIDDPLDYHVIINVDRYSPKALVALVGEMVMKPCL